MLFRIIFGKEKEALNNWYIKIRIIKFSKMFFLLLISLHQGHIQRKYIIYPLETIQAHVITSTTLPTAWMPHSTLPFFGPGFLAPGLISVGYKYCSRMCMAYLYYELSSYNTAKMAEMSGDTRAVGSMYQHLHIPYPI